MEEVSGQNLNYAATLANKAQAEFEAETGKRTCEACKLDKPLDEHNFYPVANGKFQKVCKVCKNNEHKYRIIRENEKIAAIAAKKLAGNIKAPHVSELCEDMIASFGGLTEFVAEWKKQYEVKAASEPGSKQVMDNLYSVIKLVAMSTQHRSSTPDVKRMSEEDMERELTERLGALKLYQKNFTDEPPFDTEDDGRPAQTA